MSGIFIGIFAFYLTFLGILKISSMLSEEHAALKVASMFFALGIMLLAPLYLYTSNPIVLKYYLGMTTNFVMVMFIYAFTYFAVKVLKSLKWLKIKQ